MGVADLLEAWADVEADFARFYPGKDLRTMSSREFWVLFPRLPAEALSLRFLADRAGHRPDGDDGDGGVLIEDPEEITKELSAMFGL